MALSPQPEPRGRMLLWWKISAAIVAVVLLAGSILLGAWEAVDENNTDIPSVDIDQEHDLGPFTLSVHRAGWVDNPEVASFLNPQKKYVIVSVAVTNNRLDTSFHEWELRHLLTVEMLDADDQPIESGQSGAHQGEAKTEPHVGLRMVYLLRQDDSQFARTIQPGFDQEFLTVWEAPEGADFSPRVRVSTYSTSMRRSTLTDEKVWTDPAPAGVTLLDTPLLGGGDE